MTSRFALAVVVLAAVAGNARAAEAPVKAVVHPGPLSLAPARDVTSPSEGRRGLVQVLVEVTDARGNGRGWILAARPAVATRVLGVSVRCAPASTCTLPGGQFRPPAALAAGRTASLVSAASRTGMGRIDVTATLAAAAVDFSLRPA